MANNRPTPGGLKNFWNKTVAELTELEPVTLDEAEKERHRIFSLLLLSLIYKKWNGNRFGPTGDYGVWRTGQETGGTKSGEKLYEGGSYLGHNIAALAVDGEGRVIDFDFNHNEVFESTVEHAESRLVRRVFALNQLYAPWYALDRDPSTPDSTEGHSHAERDSGKQQAFAMAISADDQSSTGSVTEDSSRQIQYASLLKDVTIYTSLESCAQCSGIMCLSSVKNIVYLQWDQGQFLVGNIMRQATEQQTEFGFVAPRPIRGDEFGFEYFTSLNAAYDEFREKVKTDPFYTGPGVNDGPVRTAAITSFLCTDQARTIFSEAAGELSRFKSEHPDFNNGVRSGLTNEQVLVQARDFLEWASLLRGRGAPHRV